MCDVCVCGWEWVGSDVYMRGGMSGQSQRYRRVKCNGDGFFFEGGGDHRDLPLSVRRERQMGIKDRGGDDANRNAGGGKKHEGTFWGFPKS